MRKLLPILLLLSPVDSYAAIVTFDFSDASAYEEGGLYGTTLKSGHQTLTIGPLFAVGGVSLTVSNAGVGVQIPSGCLGGDGDPTQIDSGVDCEPVNAGPNDEGIIIAGPGATGTTTILLSVTLGLFDEGDEAYIDSGSTGFGGIWHSGESTVKLPPPYRNVSGTRYFQIRASQGSFTLKSATFNVVPEPNTALLILLSLFGVACVKLKRVST